MSNTTGPDFYKIDFEREVVLQGKSSTFLTINRNDDVLGPTEDLYVVLYPNSRTFECVGHFNISQTYITGGFSIQGNNVSEGFVQKDLSDDSTVRINNAGIGLYVKNTQDFLPNNEGPIKVKDINTINVSSTQKITKITLEGPTGGSEPIIGATGSNLLKQIDLGYYSDVDKNNWRINTVSASDLERLIYTVPATGAANDFTSYPNYFDGSSYSATGGVAGGFTGTGSISRTPVAFSKSSLQSNSPGLTGNRGITLRIDYEGQDDAHLKLNLLIFRFDTTDPTFGSLTSASPLIIPESIAGTNNPTSFANPLYGFKSGDTSALPVEYSDNIDYQEIHLFGYTETTVRTTRQTYQNAELATDQIYDDRSSYGVLKTNPKLTGNVKLTVDSKGELSLNSFNANTELSDSKYKRFTISPESQYQTDLYNFFRNTPQEIIYDLYQVDDQYQNTKRSLYEQYDNFYNYGVEQLASKFYDEDFTFLAPLWMRKVMPEYFVIFRVDHPAAASTYANGTQADLFNELFANAQIIKTYDMRETSNLGKYLRKVVNDPRFTERPLEVSYDDDVPTTWYGISYKDGTITGKGELLSDFWKEDRPIKEFEEYITSGFERNGLISTNLINLEFLFDDPEATPYSINRYFGMYVSELQLAEFELASSVLGKISGQDPAPKPGVDGEPYSTRTFIQSNVNGIELPVEYYHSTKLNNNTSNVPYYQGNVIGKLPLPSMVDDPLRIFYVKDKDDVFKRIIGLSEVDYGFPGTDDYKRVTQLKLFDTSEDISKYGGPVQIISQIDSALLDANTSQLVVNLINQGSGDIIEEDEVLELAVKNYNTSAKAGNYYFQVSAVGGTATSFTYFQDQDVTTLSTNFTQPAVGSNVTAAFASTQSFIKDETIYIVKGGYYKVMDIISSTSATLKNIGSTDNVAPATTISANSLVGSFPTGIRTYTYTSQTYDLNIDTLVTLDLRNGYGGSSSTFTLLDSFSALIDFPEIYQDVIYGTPSLNVVVKPPYTEYRWRMNAQSSGLKKGSAWPFPTEDPNGYDFISNFSNKGTESDVALAIASCINSFPNTPALALAENNTIILKSKLKGNDGNTIEFRRYPINKKSYIKNVGFYEDGNVKVVNNVSLINVPGLTSSDGLTCTLNQSSDIYGSYYYYVRILKTGSGNSVILRTDVDPSYPTTTGTYYSFFSAGNVFQNNVIPFTIDYTSVSTGSYQDFLVKVDFGTVIAQYFVGGTLRNRSRAKINVADGQRYYKDNQITVNTTLISGSNVVTPVSLENIFVGAPVIGTGIPNNTKVLLIDDIAGTIQLSNPVTETGTYEIKFGNLSILNNTAFLQQWFQTAKSQFSRLKPWEVQGKYIYSLPYLDKAVYNERTNLPTSYTDKNTYSIIEIGSESQEFYLSQDKRIVAYEMFRPTLGILKMFPLKEFDFDFFLSDYSYTPIIESFRYFFDETIESGNSVELPADENFVIFAQEDDPTDSTKKITVASTIKFNFEVYDQDLQSWNIVDTAQVVITTSGFIINTYTPFYRYDEHEHPQRWNDDASYLIRGSGLRNFERVLFTNRNVEGTATVKDPKKFRISYIGDTSAGHSKYINIQKSDYSQDTDIKEFSGFAGLQDILNLNDQQDITILKDEGKYVDSYLRQLLLSEYDRLRENYTKEFATLSRVVPFINKWVQEGTDARDNYYRLNTSSAFGLSNLSPDDSVDYAEPLILSHEFPYLDTVPKDYPEESIKGSRSYMFAKLSDVAANNKTWYELLTSDNTKDWFLKYFTVGYPTEIGYYNDLIPKSREERFNFFAYNGGIDKVQTLFRGAKIQVLDIDTSQTSLPVIADSTKYNEYKFSAVQRTIPYDFYETQPPLEFEIVKNEKFKTIVLIITRRTQDYRVQSGLSDYIFNYAAHDNLKNYNQQQNKLSNFLSYTGADNFSPYTNVSINTNYEVQGILRPRQMFMGGGYLQLGDPKLSGYIDTLAPNSFNTATNYLNTFLTSSTADYPFFASDEILPFDDNYPVSSLPASYPFIYSPSNTLRMPIAYSFGSQGFMNKFISVGKSADILIQSDFSDQRVLADSILIDNIGFSSQKKYSYFKNNTSASIIDNGLSTFTFSHNTYPFINAETFSIQGGTNFYGSSKNLLSFANIKRNINSDDSIIKYYQITDAGKQATEDFKLRIIAADQIIKTGVLNYKVDEDKPPQYQNAPVIGYDIVNTNQNELVIRHRGFYEPKSMDILSFWLREDEEMTLHFDKDFLLSNTHVSGNSNISGVIRNYGINKVANQEILKISEGTAYESVYQLINEIAIDKKDVQVLNSTWDKGYFRKYISLDQYQNVDGWNEMKEFKAFLGSKAMTVPKTLSIETLNSNEVFFNVSSPSVNSGLNRNATENSSKPILKIDLALKDRISRFLIDGMNEPGSVDEFTWMRETNAPFDISANDVPVLKESYIKNNIIPLYEVVDIILYSLEKDGIPIFVSNLTDIEKTSAGYRQDKDCVVTQTGSFNFTITKTLDTKKSVGYSVGIIVKRI